MQFWFNKWILSLITWQKKMLHSWLPPACFMILHQQFSVTQDKLHFALETSYIPNPYMHVNAQILQVSTNLSPESNWHVNSAELAMCYQGSPLLLQTFLTWSAWYNLWHLMLLGKYDQNLHHALNCSSGGWVIFYKVYWSSSSQPTPN